MSDPDSSPYADTREHLRDEFVRVDLLLRRALDRWQPTQGKPEDGLAGLFISDREVDGLLHTVSSATRHIQERQNPDDGPSDEIDLQLEELTTTIRERARRSVEEGADLRLLQLANAFELSNREVDALLIALAPTIDDKYGRVVAYLRNDISATQPTEELIRRVLDDGHLDSVTLLARHREVRSAGLLTVASEQSPTNRTVHVPERVAGFLLGSDALPAVLEDCCTVFDPSNGDTHEDGALATDKLAAEVDISAFGAPTSTAHGRVSSSAPLLDKPVFGGFVGEDQRAGDHAIRRICKEQAVPLIRMDGASIPPDRISEMWTTIGREARLRDAAVQVTGIDALASERTSGFGQEPDEAETDRSPDRLKDVIRGLDTIPTDVFVSGDVSITPAVQARLSNHRYVHRRCPRPDIASRRELWQSIEELPDDVNAERLASTYRFTTGDIEDAVQTARSLSPDTLTAEALFEACQYHARGPLEGLATELTPSYGWDDIVVPVDTHEHLREIAAAMRHRGTVFEEWAFAERFSTGSGINVLFVGKSGTGKTMSAEIIANDVGLPIYKIDLAQIISKYIGETEKNLRRVFDAAADSNAILFFDEADAIFGERTEISDAHDRYANVEVDYLLQQMEEHDGCVILASNLKENIDDAFQRRLSATVSFPMPDADAREDIWRSIFPTACPVGDVDEAFLAEFELSGGDIKNVALTAAFLAAEEEVPVGMDHLVRALRREFQKTGKLYDLEAFGPYREVLA